MKNAIFVLVVMLLLWTAQLDAAPTTAPQVVNGNAQNQTHFLKEYESNYTDYKEVEIGEKKVYYYQRMLNGAIVEKDQVVYQFDKNTKELLAKKVRWRDDLPERLPEIKVTKEQAESMVPGNVLFSKLYIISPESDVFPIEPTPKNPCWAVRSIDVDDGYMFVTVIDAVDGTVLGNGVPPPYTAFSLTGPEQPDQPPCSGGWIGWYANAARWFDTMGYSTESIKWPTEDEVKSHIQSDETALFYEIAHGGSAHFCSGCSNSTEWSEIEAWIEDYEKMPFTFIGSCDGMCNTGDNTLSYEFRKGSSEDTVTVGHCGMGGSSCDDCFSASIGWQSALFDYINQSWTIKDAFDQAIADYPQCLDCMRFAGDETFFLVPRVKRDPNITAYYPNPDDGTDWISIEVDLQWTPGVGANSHNVYFGTDFNDVNDAIPENPMGVYQGNQTEYTFDTNTLNENTLYYWRIDEVDGGGAATKGYVWTFETGSKTLHVPTSRFPTIQSAVDAAWDDVAGITVIVAPGTYTGSGNRDINFNGKPITVQSVNPNDPVVVSSTVIDCQTLDMGFHFNNSENEDSVVDGFTITNSSGSAIFCFNSSPTITNCVLVGNSSSEGGAICCWYSHPAIINCTISENRSIGVIPIGPLDSMTTNGTINGNQVRRFGGGGVCCYSGSPTITNCTITNNEAIDNEYGESGAGGGVWYDDSNPTISNCTFSGNSAVEGGGIYNYNSDPTITNCIFWDNTPEEIYVYSGTPVVTYSDVQGGFSDNNNIDVDPCFVDTSSSDPNKWDYHLQSQRGRWDPNQSKWVTDANTSPCIDMGDPNSDWTAELWPHGKRINMGAYGGTPQASMSLSDAGNIADLNNDGKLDYNDLADFAGKWQFQQFLLREDLNRDGFVDIFDFAIFGYNWPWQE